MSPAAVWLIVCGACALLALVSFAARSEALAGLFAVGAAAAAIVSTIVSVGTAALT